MAACETNAAAPIAIVHTAHIIATFPPPPTSAPPSPPPPPSPASPASPSLLSTPFHPPARPTHLLRRTTTLRPGPHPVFDLESSSPLSPSGADKTLLLARLERARNTQVLLRSGEPARPLTECELHRLRHEDAEDSSAASGTGTGGESGTTGTEDVEDGEASPPPAVEVREAPTQDSVSLASVLVRAVEPAARVASSASLPSSPRMPLEPRPLTVRSTVLRSVRTAPPTPSRSPITAHFPALLRRAPTSSAHLDPAQAYATAATSRSAGAGGRQLAQRLAEAAAGQHAHQHTHAPGRPLRAHKATSPTRLPTLPTPELTPPVARTQALGKTRSLPLATSAPPTPLLASSSQHARAATFPAHPVPPPSPVFPSHRTEARARSRTAPLRPSPSPVAASPSSSPLLLPVMGAADPSALTLHFARKPDMPRKGSLGDSWSRMCLRGERERTTAKGVFGSWTVCATSGAVRAARGSESEETEESGAEGDAEEETEVLRGVSETSIFASPRSSFASSYFTSTLSRSRSVSSTYSPTPSSSVSPSDSPKLQPVKLGGSAGPYPPRGRWEDVVGGSEPPAPPAPGPTRKAASDPSKATAAPIVPGEPAQVRAGVEMRRLRAEQMARRKEALAKKGDCDAWDSSSSGADAASSREEAPSGNKEGDRRRVRGSAAGGQGIALRRG
ncbi:hypothetical protein JCM3770_003334 [Rhodotorula araucariae]